MLDVKEIISKSVGKLLETRADISRLNLSKRMQVADGTLGRIKYGTGNPNIETVQTIAHYFKFEPWQLLVKDFDPSSPPKLASGTHGLEALSEDEQKLVLALRELTGSPERDYLLSQAQTYVEAKKVRANKSPPIRGSRRA